MNFKCLSAAFVLQTDISACYSHRTFCVTKRGLKCSSHRQNHDMEHFGSLVLQVGINNGGNMGQRSGYDVLSLVALG